MKRVGAFFMVVVLALSLMACGNNAEFVQSQVEPNVQEEQDVQDTVKDTEEFETEIEQEEATEEEYDMTKMNVTVGNTTFTATLESNLAVDELVEMMQESPVVIEMSDYAGFEKVGNLGRGLTTSNSQVTTQSGDIVLYNGNQIVIFYGSNSWSYTKLGKIDDLTGWAEALGNGNVTVTFSVE